MKLRSWHLAIIVPLLIFGGIAVSAALNLWQTSSSKIPATISGGEFTGRPDPGDIRGSYSLADIEAAFAVPVEVLARAFGVGHLEDPGAYQVKGLEELYEGLEEGEIGTDSVRLFTALYSGLPYTPGETTRLPGPAVSQLRQLGTLTDKQLAAAEAVKVDISAFKAEPGEAEASGEEADTHAADTIEERLVRGKTTFGELLSWGMSAAEIEEVLGLPVGPRGTSLRDYLVEAGVEFSTVKTDLQERVDALPR
jgi:hypothetical protein